MRDDLITGNLVEEYVLGNTKIRIYDSAFINKSKCDIDRILSRIAEIGMKYGCSCNETGTV